MRLYEGMFLFNAATLGNEEEARQEVERLVGRGDGEIVRCQKWEERRLAYEIQDCKRGLYMLAYFRMSPDRVLGLEKDARLSETVLRLLVLRVDWVTEERMQEILPERLKAPVPTEGEGDNGKPAESPVESGGPAAEVAAGATQKAETASETEAAPTQDTKSEPVATASAEGSTEATPAEKASVPDGGD